MNDRNAARTFNNDDHEIPVEVEKQLRLKKALCIMFAKRYFNSIGSNITDPKEQIALLKRNSEEDLAFRAFVKAHVESLRTSTELSPDDQELKDMIVRVKLPVTPSAVIGEMILAKLGIEI